MDIDKAIVQLQERFGERVSSSLPVSEQHGKDWSWNPGHNPDAVVFPESTDEVVDIVLICARYGVPMIPVGAGTSVEGHFAALHGGATLDLSHMNWSLAIHQEGFGASVQAGVTREQLNRHLHDAGLFFPIDPGADTTLVGHVGEGNFHLGLMIDPENRVEVENGEASGDRLVMRALNPANLMNPGKMLSEQ